MEKFILNKETKKLKKDLKKGDTWFTMELSGEKW